jgi:hypothetical protein
MKKLSEVICQDDYYAITIFSIIQKEKNIILQSIIFRSYFQTFYSDQLDVLWLYILRFSSVFLIEFVSVARYHNRLAKLVSADHVL